MHCCFEAQGRQQLPSPSSMSLHYTDGWLVIFTCLVTSRHLFKRVALPASRSSSSSKFRSPRLVKASTDLTGMIEISRIQRRKVRVDTASRSPRPVLHAKIRLPYLGSRRAAWRVRTPHHRTDPQLSFGFGPEKSPWCWQPKSCGQAGSVPSVSHQNASPALRHAASVETHLKGWTMTSLSTFGRQLRLMAQSSCGELPLAT